MPAIKQKALSAFETLYLNGFTEELVSVLPPDAPLTSSSKIDKHDLGKVPGRKLTSGQWCGGWVHVDSIQEAQRMAAWGANIGIETTRILPIDIDVNDASLHRPLIALGRKIFGPTLPVRMGRRPLMFGRVEGSCKIGRVASVFTRAGDDDNHKIETFFGRQKQFVLVGTHPSGAQYSCDIPLAKLRFEDLPVLTEEGVREYLRQAQNLLQDKYHCTFSSTVSKVQGPDERNERPDESKVVAPLKFVEQALSKIPNNKGRDRWVEICHAIKGATQKEPAKGKALWLAWCETREDGEPHLDEAERVWNSAGKQDGGLWIGYEALLMLGGLHDDLASHQFAQDPLTAEEEAALPGRAPAALFNIQPVHARAMARPSWAIRNIVPSGACLGVMYGHPGCNKSTLATAMAVHVALGLPFAGMPVKAGHVLMISEEDAVDNRRRIAAWEAHLAQQTDMMLPESWREKLHSRVLETYPGFGHINRKKIRHACTEIIRATGGDGVQLVFIDTLARTFVEDGEENEASAMNKYIDMAEALAAELACPVIIIHHPPKNADTLRGHSSLLGAVALVLKVERTENDGHVRLYCQKMRSAAEFPPMAFTRLPVDISFAVARADDGDDEAVSALVLQPTEWTEVQGPRQASRRAAGGEGQATPEAGNEGRPQLVADMDILRHMCMQPGASLRSMQAVLGFSSTSGVAYRLKRLAEMGMVTQGSDKKWTVTHAGKETFETQHPEGVLS